MPRPSHIARPTNLHFHIPEDLRVKLDLELFSDVEQRIPYGAYGKFFADLLRKHFEEKSNATNV